MIITKLSWQGLTARDREIDLWPCNLVVGPNGAGKSTLVHALHLLVFGAPAPVPGVASDADGIMALARPGAKSLRVEAVVEHDGQTYRIARTWTRDRAGKVSAKIETNLRGPNGEALSGVKAQASAIRALLGGHPDAWDPVGLLSLSPAKMRERILPIIAAHAGEVALPANAPKWTGLAGDEPLPERVMRAVVRTKERLRESQAGAKDATKRVEDYGDARRGPQPREPLEARLRDLREEERRSRRLLELLARQAKVAEAVDVEALAGEFAVARLVLGLAEAATQAVETEANRLHTDLDAAQARRTQAKQHMDALLAEGADARLAAGLEEKRAACDAYEDRLLTARGDAGSVRIGIGALERARHYVSCACGRSDIDIALTHQEERLASLKDEADTLEGVVRELNAEVEQASRAAELVATVREFEAAGVEAQRLLVEIRALPTGDAATEWGSITEVRRLEKALAAAQVTRPDDTAELEALRGARPVAEVERDIADVLREIQALGARNERAEQLALAEADLAAYEADVTEAKHWLARVEDLETALIGQGKAALERDLSAAVGAPVEVELVDARGAPTCTLRVAGVDASTLSDGERAVFLAALVRVLGAMTGAKYRPIIIDRIESVDAERRPRFLDALAHAQESGAVSQIIVAGCLESEPDVTGWAMHELKREEQ